MKGMGAQQNCVAIIAAYRQEVGALLRRQGNVRRLGDKRFSLWLHGRPVALAIAGAGAENAYRTAHELIQTFSAAGVISIGFAGGLSDSLGVGELLVAAEVIDEGTGERFPCRRDLLPVELGVPGILLSTDAVVNSAAAKRALAARWNALAVDMESSGVARASKELKVPFGAIKCITDAASQSMAIDFRHCRSDDGGLSTWKVVREGMTSPQGILDLWKLAGSSRRAASKLALALCSA
jgi:adenosylhomocysteine nucleosidase